MEVVANSSIKDVYQESINEGANLPRTRKLTMRSKFKTEGINDMEMKLGGKIIERESGKQR